MTTTDNNVFVLHINHVAAMMLGGISVEEKIKRKWQREILLKRERKNKNILKKGENIQNKSHLHSYSPHFPWNVFWRKWPPEDF